MAGAQQRTLQSTPQSAPAVVTDAMLRRVAIVLGSLPPQVASRLMASLDGETKQRVREEIRNLSDVDPLELRRAYVAFKGSFSQHMSPSRESVSQAGDSFVSASHSASNVGSNQPTSRIYRMDDADVYDSIDPTTNENDTGQSANENASYPEMTFLGDIDDDVLTRVIAGEHPQAIAFVLASIAPAQAARIVTTLDPRLQSEALNRIARLDEASDEVISDFADHLKKKVERFGARPHLGGGTAGGKQSLQAILDAMPDRQSFANPTERQPQDNTHQTENQAGDDSRRVHQHASVVDEVMTPRIAPDTVPPPQRQTSQRQTIENAVTPEVPEPSRRISDAQPFESTDAIHQHLIKLKPMALCSALAEVETRQALLTLCGLPNNVAEKVLAALPRGQAKQVRAKLGSLGSLQLREIDEAKELVALVSIGRKPGSENMGDPTRSSEASSRDAIPIAA